MSEIKIVSLNRGLPQNIKLRNGNTLYSGLCKRPTDEKIFLSTTGFEEDDTAEDYHGGESMALHVFAHENYAFYNSKAGFELPIPAFGENLTLSGYTENEARVGDILKIGNAKVQVSQPTERCKNIGLSLGLPQMLKWIHEELRTGFYFRVLQEGEISVESEVHLLRLGSEEGLVAKLNQVMFRHISNQQMVEKAAKTESLSPEWQTRILKLHKRALEQ